jgi:tRNA (cmo5U34)-methyltransferase
LNQDEITAVFDKQAAGYDRQWNAMAPIRDALLRLTELTLGNLPADAQILSVGAGTGFEVAYLAARFPDWTFTVVEPSAAMAQKCIERAETDGFAARCEFHNGYLESLPADGTYGRHHAALCFLVSQFIVDRAQRTAFFGGIAEHLVPGGILLSSDLASPAGEVDFETLLRAWMMVMAGPGMANEQLTEERLDGARLAYTRDVGVIPPDQVADIIMAGGFETSVQIFQAGLLHGWHSVRPH